MGFFEQNADLLQSIFHITLASITDGEPTNRYLFYTDNQWGKQLYDIVREAANEWRGEGLDTEDLLQEIRLIWVQSLKCFEGLVIRKMHRKSYVVQRTIFQLRDWVLKQSKMAQQLFIPQDDELPIKLDLDFLLYGTDLFPLSTLTEFERYLLYLRYKEGKTLEEISSIIHRHHATIQSRLRDIFNRLRSLNNGQNTSRYSDG